MRSVKNILIKEHAKATKRTGIKFDRKNPRKMQFNEKNKIHIN
jgi:signal recognition particle subunit SEC65